MCKFSTSATYPHLWGKLRIYALIATVSHPLLIITTGYPGSGKTHFATRFCAENNFAHLNSDSVRLEMFKQPTYQPEEHAILFRAMDIIARTLLQHSVNVFFDANHNQPEHRQAKYLLAQKQGAKCILLWFQTPLDVAATRVQNRSRGKDDSLFRNIDPAIVHRMSRDLVPPATDEPTVAIDGTVSYKQQVRALVDYIARIR